jgi:hypothetical protein
MKLKLLFSFVLLSSIFAHAQKEDLELWGSVKFSKKVSPKFRFELEEQVRWADSISVYKKNFTDIGLRYKWHKRHSISTHFRVVDEAEKDKTIRFNIDQSSTLYIKKISLSLKQRLRYQQSWDELSEKDKTLVRAKWSCNTSEFDHLNPYIAHEFYWDITDETTLSKQRTTLGVSWEISKDLKFQLFWRMQKERNVNKPKSLKIIGLGTHYKF